MHSRAIGFCSRSGRFSDPSSSRKDQPPVYLVLTPNVANMLLFLEDVISTLLGRLGYRLQAVRPQIVNPRGNYESPLGLRTTVPCYVELLL